MSEMIQLKRIPGDKHTPFGLARKLRASVILESSSLTRGRSRYSILMVREAFRVIQTFGGDVFLHVGQSNHQVSAEIGDILNYVETIAGEHDPYTYDFPVPAGGIGFLSFEFSKYCDTIRIPERVDPLGLPEAAFIFGHVFLVFDHYSDEIILLGLNYEEHSIDLEKSLDECEKSIRDFNFNYMVDPLNERNGLVLEDKKSERDYCRYVAAIKEEIIAGNLLQCVPSRRIELESDLEAIEAYRNLRSSNPSPYMFYLDFGDFQLFGASPEVHAKAKNGRAFVRPIAGTRRRGNTQGEDLRLEEELLACEKEKAEHLMLVDLARNDLARVCVPGTVKVTESMSVERYSRVMHLVSQVEGDLVSGMKASGVLRATFPAGTVSGAPKIRAIETISSLESHPRGFYAGLVGYFEPNGNLDTCITIRSAVKKNGRFYLQAGGGVVHDSTPDRELEETREKLSGTARALGIDM